MPPPVPRIRIAGGVNPRSDRGALPNPVVPISGTIARAASVIGGNVQAITNQVLKDQAAADAINAQKAYGEFEREAKTAIQGLNPLSPTYLQDVEKAYKTAQEGAVGSSQLSTPEVLQRLNLRLTAVSERAGVSAIGIRHAAIVNEAKKQRAAARAAEIEKIRSDPEAARLYLQAHQKTAVAATKEVLDPGNAGSIEDADDFREFSRAEVQGFLERGEFGKASRAAAVAGRTNAELGGELTRQVKTAELDAEIQGKLTSGTLVDRLEARALAGDDRLPSLVMRAARDKFISKGEANSLLKKFRTERRNRNEEQRLVNEAATAARDGKVITEKQADLIWESRAKDIIENTEDPRERAKLIGQFVQLAGLSRGVKSILAQNEGTGSRESLAENARVLEVLTQKGVNYDKAGFQSQLVFNFARNNPAKFRNEDGSFDYEGAASVVLEKAPKTEQEAKDRVLGTKAEFRKKMNEAIDDDLEDIIPGAPPALAARYAQAVEANFITTGDFDLSRETAKKFLQSQYGVSNVNANPDAEPGGMFLAPEVVARSLPRFKNAVPEELNRQIARQMSFEIKQLIRDFEPNAGVVSAVPVADRSTQEAVQRGAEPSWAIRVTNTAGRVFMLDPRRFRVNLMTPDEQRQLLEFESLEGRLQRPARRLTSRMFSGIAPGTGIDPEFEVD
ncbi:MAG: hypothetical protein ACR2PR_08940 [Pseudohongiellaceae bacterium]